MNKFKRFVSLALVLCMVMAFVPVGASAAEDASYAYNIVHVDAGRKYFSVDSLKTIIDNAAAAGFNQVELYLSDNQGFRFALDDMSLTTEHGTYNLTPALGDGYSDGSKYPDYTGKYLTQSEMDEIIAYANEQGVDIVPCINVPGHMGAILEEFTSFRYVKNGTASKSSIDLANEEAVAFALALTEKYASYFASRGCQFYNVGADEYANDLSSMGFEGMGQTLYNKFVQFLNDAADIVIGLGMTPRAFNDGFHYGDYSVPEEINTAYEICYWSSGWNGYNVAAADDLADMGYKMINTNGDYYWVLGNSSWQCSETKASQFDETAFSGSTVSAPAGSMFCIWCDNASAGSEESVVTGTAATIAAFGAAVPAVESLIGTEDDGVVPEPTESEPPVTSTSPVATVEKTVTLEAEGTATETIEGVDYSADWSVADDSIVDVTVETETLAGETYWELVTNGAAGIEEGAEYLIANSNSSVRLLSRTGSRSSSMTVSNGKITSSVGSDYVFTFEKNGSGWNIKDSNNTYLYPNGTYTNYYVGGYWNYSMVTGSSTAQAVTISGSSSVTMSRSITSGSSSTTAYIRYGNSYSASDSSSNLYLFKKVVTPGQTNTSVTFEGLKPGTTTVTVGNHVYTVIVNYKAVNVSLILDGTASYTQSAAIEDEAEFSVEGIATAVISGSTVTFTGVAEGTTVATVGNTKYTITVAKEDLSKVEGLTVEYWITNVKVTANNATSMTIAAADANTAAGVELAKVIPATGSNGNTVSYWKTTRLDSDHQQTTASGVNRTLSGTDITRIRYYNGSWAYSADGSTWTNVASGDQIVAYYMQATAVTDEVTTEVVDWGELYGNSYNDSNYVLMDYAVKYESGERIPDAFPINGKTQKFHCSSDDTNVANGVVVRDSATGVYYRNIGSIRAVETAEYDVYMITVTPTSDSATTYLSSGANSESTGQSDFYAGTEKVVWVDDMANLGDFADSSKHYTSISGDVTFTVGGEPIFNGVEIYNRHGMLVTYYVRAKVTEDSLTVHYVDASVQGSELEFYSYNIAVKSGTLFHEKIGLNTANPIGDLTNGTVKNIYDRNQTVSSDLSTLSQIGAQYLYSDYNVTSVVRSDDGKHVTIYYKFNSAVYLVADFGLPMEIQPTDLSAKFQGAAIKDFGVGGATVTTYGHLSKNTAAQTVTYQLDQTIDGVDSFTLRVTTGDDDTADFRVYVVPASTVYYEETFADFTGTWETSAGTGRQEVQTKDATPYGYSAAYDSVGASDGSEAKSNASQDKASFAFTGTGVDIYANCDTDTSVVFVTLKNAEGKVLKMYQVSTLAKGTESGVTAGQAVESFNLPIVSVTGLAYGSYTVELLHTKKADDAKVLRIDGFRVYEPMGDNVSYYNASEQNVTFADVRDNVLVDLNVEQNANFDRYVETLYSQVYTAAGTTAGAVVLNGNPNVQDLLDKGPKNEIFLQPGASLVVNLTGGAQIGLKAVSESAAYTINDGEETTISTSTEMYYSVSGKITIHNTGDTLLSITKLKLYNGTRLSEITEQQLAYALTLMGLAPADAETDAPEQEICRTEAALTVKVTDYKNRPVTELTLTAEGVQGEQHTFTAAEILAAVKDQLPESYALVNESKLTDVSVTFGGSETIVTRAGKAAVVEITFVDRRTGAVVGVGEIVRVQTSDRSWIQITASDIREAAPAGYKVVKAQSLKAAYGSSYCLTVSVG